MRAEEIHQAPIEKGLLPKEHLVNAAYVSAEILIHGLEQHGIGVVGPQRPEPEWQAETEGAYTAEDFHMDREKEGVPNRGLECYAGEAMAEEPAPEITRSTPGSARSAP
jgi:hypothetical protein